MMMNDRTTECGLTYRISLYEAMGLAGETASLCYKALKSGRLTMKDAEHWFKRDLLNRIREYMLG